MTVATVALKEASKYSLLLGRLDVEYADWPLLIFHYYQRNFYGFLEKFNTNIRMRVEIMKISINYVGKN